MLKPPFLKWPELQISKSKMEKMDEFIVKETKFTVFSFTVGQTESKGQTKYFTIKRGLIQRFCQSHDFAFIVFRLYNKDAVGYINPFL